MAVFRKIHTTFWSDSFIQTLTPEQKFFFLYLLTNERTRACGVYETSLRQISFDTGYNIETVQKLLDFFEECGKVRFSAVSCEVAIKNWNKYNGSRSPDVQSLVNKELKNIKNKDLIKWVHSDDTVVAKSNHRGKVPVEEKEKEKEKEK